MKQNLTGFSSRAIHNGFKGDTNRSHNTPIYATSTYYYDSVQQGANVVAGMEKGFLYQRYGSPNSIEVEEKIASLEAHGLDIKLKGIMHSSGQAALSTMFFAFLKPGDTIIASQPLYGGSQELITGILSQYNINSMIIDLSDIKKVEQILKTNKTIKWMHIETPANPTIDCIDLEQMTNLVHQFNIKISVDNTFATPYLQQPFKYGVDYVVHSTTKYLNGHGTALGGILIGRDDESMEKALKWQRIMGNNSNPFDCFLLNQGLKTLELRMERHCQNAMKVAEFLSKHSLIENTTYLGLKSHKHYEIAKKQMRYPGAVITFELKGGFDKAVQFMNSLKMCVRAVSLGSADTLISHPASTTHALQSREVRLSQGIKDGLVRISVGLESVEDIIYDLDQALCNSDDACKSKVEIINNIKKVSSEVIQAKPRL